MAGAEDRAGDAGAAIDGNIPDAAAQEATTPDAAAPDRAPASEADATEPPEPQDLEASRAAFGTYPAPPNYGAAPVEDSASLEGVPGARQHEGFFVRLLLGPGAGRTHYKERVDGTHVSSVEASGLSGTFDLSVGGRAVGNLIVHGNLSYTRFRSPTRRIDGVKDAAVPVRSTGLMLGAGATYYFMPYNVFLTGAVGPAWFSEERDNGSFRTKTGFFLQLAPGKEWWVGARGAWGLGAALRLSLAAAPVSVGGVSSTLKYGDITLAFSTTFN